MAGWCSNVWEIALSAGNLTFNRQRAEATRQQCFIASTGGVWHVVQKMIINLNWWGYYYGRGYLCKEKKKKNNNMLDHLFRGKGNRGPLVCSIVVKSLSSSQAPTGQVKKRSKNIFHSTTSSVSSSALVVPYPNPQLCSLSLLHSHTHLFLSPGIYTCPQKSHQYHHHQRHHIMISMKV